MANIIAVIWDFDRTLIDGHMQDPIFKRYGVDAAAFWNQVNAAPAKIAADKKIRVNADTYYLNHFIRCAHDGTFEGLNNKMLRDFGKEQKFYPGVPEILRRTKELLTSDDSYAEFGIQVEHYIVSTGFAETIRGTELIPLVEEIWGCELLDDENGVIGDIVYTIDNTTKTRAIFEINKGIGKREVIDVNSKVPKELRRVQFENMIYIADGPSDVPAFSLIGQNGGSTFAVYPKGNMEAMKQVEQMRQDGRVDMFAEADYREGTTACMWIANKILELADRIRTREKEKVISSATPAPHHLI